MEFSNKQQEKERDKAERRLAPMGLTAHAMENGDIYFFRRGRIVCRYEDRHRKFEERLAREGQPNKRQMFVLGAAWGIIWLIFGFCGGYLYLRAIGLG